MIRSGRKCLAHRFLTHHRQDFWREQSGSQIYPLFRQGTAANGGITVCFGDGEPGLIDLSGNADVPAFKAMKDRTSQIHEVQLLRLGM